MIRWGNSDRGNERGEMGVQGLNRVCLYTTDFVSRTDQQLASTFVTAPEYKALVRQFSLIRSKIFNRSAKYVCLYSQSKCFGSTALTQQ